jgi:hypothetical protein
LTIPTDEQFQQQYDSLTDKIHPSTIPTDQQLNQRFQTLNNTIDDETLQKRFNALHTDTNISQQTTTTTTDQTNAIKTVDVLITETKTMRLHGNTNIHQIRNIIYIYIYFVVDFFYLICLLFVRG